MQVESADLQLALAHQGVNTDELFSSKGWPDVATVSIQTADPVDKANEDLSSLRTLRGTWQKILRCTELQSDNVLRPANQFLSADSVPVMLDTDDRYR